MTFTVPALPQQSADLEAEVRARVDGKAKPPGALGRIEDLAVRLAVIQNRSHPVTHRAQLFVFAGDHGLNQEGVSRYPSAVTCLMVATFLAGKASVSAFARATGVDVTVVDAGVDADLAPHPALIDAKIRKGTANAAVEPAMNLDEVSAALEVGRKLAAESDADLIVIGEMGIGNTASSSLLLHRLGDVSLEDAVGDGAGQDDEGRTRKLAVLKRAADRTAVTDPLTVLAEFGGLEIAMMAGCIIGAAETRKPVLVDGFIAGAAALAASKIAPGILDACIFAHHSAERGHSLMLQQMGAEPLLNLGLRLGEGTGGVLAVPMCRAAAAMLNETASLADVLEGRL
jgi:nicotinate-nucleotide--dimethylbenzimidazole phosphoribosyltransferase